MKKIGIILVLFLILVTTGCTKESKILIENKKYSLSIDEETLTKESVTVVLKNNSEKAINYDEEYFIDQKKNKKWYRMEPLKDVFYNLPLYGLEAKESREIVINWKDAYGKLSKGVYRIVKEITTSSNEQQYVGASFTIQ